MEKQLKTYHVVMMVLCTILVLSLTVNWYLAKGYSESSYRVESLKSQNTELQYQLYLKDDSRFEVTYLKVYEHFDMWKDREWIGYILANPNVNKSGYNFGMNTELWWVVHSPRLYASLNNSETYLATVDLNVRGGPELINVSGIGIKNDGMEWNGRDSRETYKNFAVAPTLIMVR